MGLFAEVVATIILLVTKPFSLCKLIGVFYVRTTWIVIRTWIDFIKAAVSFHVNLILKAILWMIGLVSLPLQFLMAFQRERLLEKQLHELQFELETLVWDRKELEDHLQTAIKERRIMESMLMELEEELESAIAKIELLDGELQELKDENLRLKEIQGKAAWSLKGHHDADGGKNIGIVDNQSVAYGISSWKTSYVSGGITFQDLMINKDGWENKTKSDKEIFNLIKADPTSSGSMDPHMHRAVPKDLETNEVLGQRREAALSHSLFSAVLSLLVGMIIWEADNPCMPLVVALFTVVGLSLKSVVQFFSTIKNKPASDAVALLSFNWFILGTLTYPTLPRIALMLSPLSLNLLDQIAIWFGISFN
ncbi:hypothetical protein SLE2022_092540 [Rubroshorea leprosula]